MRYSRNNLVFLGAEGLSEEQFYQLEEFIRVKVRYRSKVRTLNGENGHNDYCWSGYFPPQVAKLIERWLRENGAKRKVNTGNGSV